AEAVLSGSGFEEVILQSCNFHLSLNKPEVILMFLSLQLPKTPLRHLKLI
ncbi:MAG: hypothetical protein QG610_315, partial [Euryarchaeota archaeon]|nr:hypothetical protein [Euryarchaeota archaeon]